MLKCNHCEMVLMAEKKYFERCPNCLRAADWVAITEEDRTYQYVQSQREKMYNKGVL